MRSSGKGGGASQDGSSATLVNSVKNDASDSVGFRLASPPSGMCLLKKGKQFFVV